MISSMESQLGLTILDQSGTNLRVFRSNPAYEEVRALLRDSKEPSNVTMDRIQALLADPLEAILRWSARMGFPLSRSPAPGEIVVSSWAPFLSRLMKVGSTPEVAIRLARQVAADGTGISMDQVCTLWTPANRGRDATVQVLHRCALPAEARIGDHVANLKTVTGPSIGLVATLTPWDGVADMAGEVVQVGGNVQALNDVLREPSILGLNRTYRCEEAGESGWLEDFSFDSLTSAIENLKDIRAHGAEARLVNRITNTVINV